MSDYKIITAEDIFSLLKQNENDRLTAINVMNYRKSPAYRSDIILDTSRSSFYKEVFEDNLVDGFVMSYPNNYGTVIRQAQRSYYYRGENQIYKHSTPSLYRKLSEISDPELKQVEEFVSDLRIADFLELILQFNHTKQFMNFSRCILYEQLAQHYGFDTRWLDLTSDFEVALFFACCKIESNKWRPLKHKDFNKNKDTRYGVIFRRKTNDPIDVFNAFNEQKSTNIFPVGFQPFMRCHSQSSYVAHKKNTSFDLKDVERFELLKFKHSEKLSNFIFTKLNFGKDIYPYEGLNLIMTDIDLIKNKKIFSRNTFNFVCENKKISNKEDLENTLIKYKYEIKHVPAINLSNDKITEINKLYSNFDIEKTFNINLRTRRSC